ncbi:membrane protein YdbS with pleckstrin-like domain [Psychromicrobium silvestre]|uniref:Membrane protein YdbS with pleckstrin-like domain n=1 Tax=Psychromicrobium silvestre TaxID=1645614 RepID=A0A7Y9LTR0_9MICC|nr:hypothetical protein [Psychromicrobium silvestre]NYE95428.1 membrane protein YdbS with pleckstrin-like domain [Psychromicrobium silvestre]
MTDLIEQTIAPRHFHPEAKAKPKFQLRPVHAAAALAILAATFMIATMVLLLGSLMLGMGLYWLPMFAAAAICAAAAVWLTAKFH